METYPILIDGEAAGRLTVERQGSLTTFEADCEMREGLIRLSVYGGGREGYLGVLAPEGDRLTLRKRLSRSQTRTFPETIERVGRAGEPGGAARTVVERPDLGVERKKTKGEETDGESPGDSGRVGDDTRKVETKARNVELDGLADGENDGTVGTDARTTEPPELHWFASPDGALVCFDGKRSLAALPLGDPRIPAGAEGRPRRIEGRDYLVFEGAYV